MLYISGTSRYTKTVYIGIYLVYLVLAYKEMLYNFNCLLLFLPISELLPIT